MAGVDGLASYDICRPTPNKAHSYLEGNGEITRSLEEVRARWWENFNRDFK